jgi:hypothetical protein
MNQRCYKEYNTEYKNYGARGITVCDRWRGPSGYQNFLADMGRRPSPQHSIERKDNNGNYSPENCVWATALEQGANKRNNRLVTHQGETLHLSEWARRTGVKRRTLAARLDAGWPIEEALKQEQEK